MKSVRFFWRYVTYRKDLLMALLGCALVTAAAELTIPWLLRQAIDTALGEMSGTSLEALGLWMIGVIVLLADVMQACGLRPGAKVAAATPMRPQPGTLHMLRRTGADNP